MSGVEVAEVAFMALIASVGTVKMIQGWGSRDPYRDMPGRQLLGDRLWRGGRRALPAVMVSLWGLVIAGAVSPFAVEGGAFTSSVWAAVVLTAASMFVVGCAATIMVALFGWPEVAVPPKLRPSEHRRKVMR